MPHTEELKQNLEKCPIPADFSGTILVTQFGEPLFSKTQGWAIRSEKIPNGIETRYQTASGCKGFTALAILQLCQAGHLSLSDRLADIIEFDFPNFSNEITLRHLLTHSAGITSYFEEDIDPDYEALWSDLPMYKIRQPADFIPLFQNKNQKFPPGDHFEYNDGGFILLGLVVEAISGCSFIEYIQENIFKPAGMKRSGYFYADHLPEGCAQAYIEEENGTWRTNTFAVPIVGGPDGGAYVTAPDMARFWAALYSGELLDQNFVKEMLSPQIKAEETWYGLGVWIEKDKEGIVPYLEGWDPGVSIISALLPQQNITLSILSNTNKFVWESYSLIREKLRL